MTNRETIDRLVSQIHEEFPDLTWTSIRIEDGGWDHFAIILDNSVVFRMPKTEEQCGYFGDEIVLLDVVAKYTRMPIPRVTYISSDKTIMGYSYLPGNALSAGIIERLDKELFEIVRDQLSQFLGDVHGISAEAYSNLPISKKSPHNEITWLRAGYITHLQGQLPNEDCLVIERFLDDLELCMVSCSTRVLLHGDLDLEQILLDRHAKNIAVIDFSDWAYGDPAFDFSGLYDSPMLAQEVFRKYRHKEGAGNLLARAELYNRRIPLSMMIDACRSCPSKFDESYREFKRRFARAGITEQAIPNHL